MNAPSIRKQKSDLRQVCRARRRRLDPSQVAAAGRAVLQRVLGLEEYAAARLVHTYVSGKENEVETRGLIQTTLEQGKRVAVPVVQRGSRTLLHAEIQELDRLEPDEWGIPSPLPGHADWIEDLSAFDLVVVPGIAFDRQGRRLGFGGGYYDRFLHQIRAPRIGLTYESLLLDEVPIEPHDAAVEILITEFSTIRVGASRPTRE